MRKLLLLISAMFIWLGVYSQGTLPYNDDFESYTVGGFMAVQNTTWYTTWSNLPGSGEDAIISDAFANSPTKSVKVETSTDLILKLGNKTTGKYELKWKMYVETGKAGYYNIQHFQSPGTEYANEVYFLAAGGGKLFAGSTTAITFTYPKDSWFEVKNLIDLDADLIKMYVNGILVHQWPFSYQSGGTTGTKQLGGVDFFAGAEAGETPKFFFDDLTYQVMPTVLYETGFDTFALNSFVAVSEPTWFTTWSNLPGSGEDAIVKSDFAHTVPQSAQVMNSTDLILKLGNKVTGKYDLNWWMYVETGKAGYYNLQHFQSPGTEYACEIYFKADGSGYLLAGSTTQYPFTYPKAAWFEVKHYIDLDADLITLWINGLLVKTWPFHYQAGALTGTNQLGGVDFYAGGPAGETPKYNFDDLYFAQVGAPTDPIIGVTPVSLETTLQTGQTNTQQLTIANTGASDLVFNASIILNNDAPGSQPDPIAAFPVKRTATLDMCTAVPSNPSSSFNPETDATAVLNYDGPNTSSIQFNTPPVTATVAARFPNYKTLPHAGMYLESVEVYINSLNLTNPNNMIVKIFGSGTSYEPGALITSEPFTPVAASWNTIMLTTPVLITGQDLWIGYQYTQSETGVGVPGTDAGPNDPNGDFLSTGVGWSHLSNNPALTRNWNIRGNLNGNPFPQWLSANPITGTVVPTGNQVVDVTFNSANLTAGTYTGIVRLWSNDPVTPQVDVPCTLTVVASICPAPTALTVTGITNSTASIGWTNAPAVEIDYGPAGHVAGTGTIISSVFSSPYELTGLNYLTAYSVYVRQDCGPGNFSPWAGPLNFTTLEQFATTVYPYNVVDGTGYVSNGSYLKKGPWMNASAAINDTSGRGYVKFDISSLPLNAIVTKATMYYYYFGGALTSTVANNIYALSNDPVTASGVALHTDCGDGVSLWSGTWTGTPPLWYNSVLNATGLSYISSQLGTGWAGFGLTRTSTALFRFAGYNDATYKPYLQLEYHVATAPVLSVLPVSKDFEQVNLGIQSIPQTFTIKNAGIGNILIDELTITGADASQFVLTDGAIYSKNLGPGASYTVTVYFKPTTTGLKTASLRLMENENEHLYTLTGTGYLNAPQNLTATPVIGPYVNLSWEAPLPLEEIRFDDNAVESFYSYAAPTSTLHKWFTRITIPADGMLNSIGVLSRSLIQPAAWESISLCPDNGGIPNLAAPIQTYLNVPVTSTSGQWILETLTTPLAVTAGQDYFIVIQWPTSAVVGPTIGTDITSNHYRCNISSNGGVSWNAFPYNLMMRAYMTVAGDNSSSEPIVLTSGTEVEGMQNLPVMYADAEPKIIAGATPASVIAPAIVAPSNPTRSFTNYTLNRGTVSGTWTDTWTGLSGTTYQDVTVVPTTTYYYMLTAEYSNGFANSNIASATTFEVCPVPTALTATGITTTSANLGWNGNGTTAWELEYGLAGHTLGTGTTITLDVTNPMPVSGLASGTAYTFYVRSNCGGGSFSSWSAGYTFTTLCGIFPAPFTENFEMAAFPPACWSRTVAAYTWERSTDASGYGIGTASAFADFYNIPATTTFDLMTLNFDASALYAPVLKFDYAYATYSASYIDEMDVYYSIDNGLTYTLLLAMPGGTTGILNTGGTAADPFVPTAAQWATQTLTLPAGTNMIKFTGISAYGNSLYLDNVIVEGTIPPVPEFLTVTGEVTNGSSCFNATNTITVGGSAPWTVMPGASATLIAGQKISFLPGTTVLNTGYMHGYIAVDGPWCTTSKMPEVAATGTEEPTPVSLEQTYFSIYPNPTTGNFTLVQKGDNQYGNVKVEVYGMRGDKVLSTQMIGEKKHEFVTSTLPTGLYFVKVVADNYTETIKLIKTR